LRFFQPLSAFGFSRLLAETRTSHILAPGLLSFNSGNKPSNFGFSGFFDSSFPPRFSDLDSSFQLRWSFPPHLSERVLSSSFTLSSQPFYPSFVSSTLSETSFSEYVSSFLSLPDLHSQIFTLPYTFFDSPLLEDVLSTDCSFFVLTGLSSLFNNQRKLSELFVSLRSRLSPDIALYIPGPIAPTYYSFLVYSGVDFFDDSLAYYLSERGFFLTSDSVYPLSNHPECYCSFCRSSPPDILGHNLQVMANKLSQIRFFLESDNLRTLVERDVHSSPLLSSTLNYFDRNYSSTFLSRFPAQQSTSLVCTSSSSLNRPEVELFRHRVRERFNPSPQTRVVILFPCSARKPYSLSRSHSLFSQSLRQAGKSFLPFLSELIITSPLSIVPRELESLYPPRFYDIPVSGFWSEEEIVVTSSLLIDVLSKFPENIIIINHTHGQGYSDIIERVSDSLNLTVYHTSKSERPTSSSSLSNLSSTLREVFSSLNLTDSNSSHNLSPFLRKLIATADYQYGPGSGNVLFSSPIRTRGKYPRDIQIFREKKLIATYLSRTGFLSLQPAAAQEILDYSLVNLDFAAETITGSSIYAPGCNHASEFILPSDEIFIVNSGCVLATARALIAGVDMNKMSSGSLAIVKKKLKLKKGETK